MFYDANDVNKLTVKRCIHISVVVSVIAITVAACVIICVFANHDNKTLMTVLACLVATAGGWVVIGDVVGFLRPSKHRIVHIKNLLACDKSTVCGHVIDISHMTVNKWMSAYRVTVEVKDNIITLLYDDAFGYPSFAAGDRLKFVTADKFIINCEACDDGKG